MKKIAIVLALIICFCSSNSFAQGTNVLHNFTFDKGMPDGWSVLSPTSDDPTAKVYISGKDKALTLSKNSNDGGNVSVARDFEGRNGTPIILTLDFSVTGLGIKNFRITQTETTGWVLVLFISNNNLFYVNKEGKNILLKDNIVNDKKYTLKMSAYTFSNKLNLSIDDEMLLANEPFRGGVGCGVGYFMASTTDVGNSITIYNFSVASAAYNFYLTDNFSDSTVGQIPMNWICNKDINDIISVVEIGGVDALNVDKVATSSVPAQATAKFTDISGGFKMQMKFLVSGSGSKTIRGLRNNGAFWLFSIDIKGSNVYYRNNKNQTLNIKQDLSLNEIHTLTIYGGENGKYDLYIDGVGLLKNESYASGQSDQPLGYLLFHSDQSGVGNLKIHSVLIEKLDNRTLRVGDVSFANSGNVITTIANGEITANLNILNDQKDSLECVMVMTCYNGDLMENIKINSIVVDVSKQQTLTCSMDIPDSSGRTIYVYLWDNMSNIKTVKRLNAELR